MSIRPDDETTTMGERPSLAPGTVTSRDLPRLIVVAGPNVGAMYRLSDGAVIGRGTDSAIRIESDEVSRRHARFSVKNGECHVEDLESRNGTYVNGKAIRRPRKVEPGDKIEIGGILLRFALFDHVDEQYQEKIYETSLRDGLTRVYNRKYFDERLEGEFAFAQRHETALSLVLFDVDHFKAINDGHGHPAGDAVLVELGAHVMNVIRTEDVLARYGGEEFAVLCRGIRLADACAFGERLRAAVEKHAFVAGDKPLPVTISVGIAALPSKTLRTAEALVQAADAALYRAKQNGRNRVEHTR